MIRSMTAFAREEADEAWGSATWELRSVNNRYLDVVVRMPEELRALEPAVRAAAAKRFSRGKLECNLRYQPVAAGDGGLTLNEELAGRLIKISRKVDSLLYDASSVSSLDIMRWPGVVETPAPDLGVVGKAVMQLLETAMEEAIASREREGAKIEAMLTSRGDEILTTVAAVKARLPEIVQGFRQRLADRLAEIRQELEPGRVEQEIVIFSQKVDVAEELDRLVAHVEEVRHTLTQRKPAGRRLDFLMQELNREANTLGSKSADAQTTRAGVDLKVLIEQMREQIQNVE